MTDADNVPGKLSDAVVAEIRKQAITQVSKWVIVAFIALIGIAGSGWWFYLQKTVDDYIATHAAGVPSAAVVAFDSSVGCPSGWDYFERGISKVIVGAYPPGASAPRDRPVDKNGRPLTARPYGADGGEESHALRLDEIPPHDHGIEVVTHEDYVKGVTAWTAGGMTNTKTDSTSAIATLGRDTSKAPLGPTTRFTEVVGTGQPIEIMPPYIPLFLCRKK